MPRPSQLAAALAGLAAGAAAGELRGRRGARIAAAAAAGDARSEHWPPPGQLRTQVTLADLLAARPEPTAPDPGTPVTDLLLARLEPGDREAIVARMADSAAELHAAADEAGRRRLEVAHATAFGPDEVRERLGLRAAMPPEEVHSMARAWSATGGDTYFADLVVAALAAAGEPLAPGAAILDFGCSSGRVLRVLAAARPDMHCKGCDPNAPAVAWAAEHLPGTYVVSPQAPPLGLADGSVDAAFAISIWSHFAEAPAATWLAELARVVRPGGALLLTTHGWDALAAGLRRGTTTHPTVGSAAAALVTRGHHFVDVFGPAGDWGVRDPGWGDAYVSADWLAAHATPAWAVEVLWPGAVAGAQDLYVLRRR